MLFCAKKHILVLQYKSGLYQMLIILDNWLQIQDNVSQIIVCSFYFMNIKLKCLQQVYSKFNLIRCKLDEDIKLPLN